MGSKKQIDWESVINAMEQLHSKANTLNDQFAMLAVLSDDDFPTDKDLIVRLRDAFQQFVHKNNSITASAIPFWQRLRVAATLDDTEHYI